MKVKDAIKILRMLDANSNMHVRGQGVAISMAIKALEQQPCEDAISRQAAIDADGVSEILTGRRQP